MQDQGTTGTQALQALRVGVRQLHNGDDEYADLSQW